jgi:hypothetical protein
MAAFCLWNAELLISSLGTRYYVSEDLNFGVMCFILLLLFLLQRLGKWRAYSACSLSTRDGKMIAD